MIRTVLTISVTVLWAPAAGAAPPNSGAVVERASSWAGGLPADVVRYRIRRQAKTSEAKLGVDRVLRGDVVGLKTPAFALMTRLLTAPSLEVLRSAGVDVEVTSLYHLNRRVVVIVGAQPMKPGTPQVWFDRDTGRLMRIVLPRGRGAVDTVTLRGPWPPHIDYAGADSSFTGVPRW